MKILRHYTDVPDARRGAVVALGNFDGVHRGHQTVIDTAKKTAESLGVPLGVVVFEPHPRQFFQPDKPFFQLTSFRGRAHLLEALGVDILYALPFDQKLAGMPAQDFVLDVLGRQLGAVHLVVGHDFRFGHGRAGDTSLLAYMAEMEGLGSSIIQPAKANDSGAIFSSTGIRKCLEAGQPQAAAAFLGHWWTIDGRVIAGDKRGRELGFPTANLSLDHTMRPAFGVYAIAVTIEDGTHAGVYHGVANVGIRPMFEVPEPLMEAFIFDFDGDLYGHHLSVSLIEFLRPEAAFEGLGALKAQIAKDCEAARKILKEFRSADQVPALPGRTGPNGSPVKA